MQILSNPGAKQLDARCRLPRRNVHWRLQVFKSRRMGFHAVCDFTIHPCKASAVTVSAAKEKSVHMVFPETLPCGLASVAGGFRNAGDLNLLPRIHGSCRTGATEEKTSTSAERARRASTNGRLSAYMNVLTHA